jgi:tetratricopeptide (TPR) repeat protein
MSNETFERALELFQGGRLHESLRLLQGVLAEDPSHWNAFYMAGQCCRFMNDIGGAIPYLERATELAPDEPPAHLALGIAYQLDERWDEAIRALTNALRIDPDYAIAYNSLALTQKKAGQIDVALENYGQGLKALARRNVLRMRNDEGGPILRHLDIGKDLWAEHAIFGAMYLVSREEGVHGFSWPTGREAEEEERTQRHRGLCWVDRPDAEGRLVRHYLPNFFNTFREMLLSDRTYAELTGNRGVVLELLGRDAEAREHFMEAEAFVGEMARREGSL